MPSMNVDPPELFETGPTPGFDEARLIAKLRAIESLFSGAKTSGERDAAEAARERIRERLRALIHVDEPEEFRFSMGDVWSRKVFLALLRRYEVRPYRYRGQRRTTVMARVPKRFVDETLWPEFQKLSATLETYLSEMTDRVVAQVLHGDSSEAEVVTEPPRLTAARQTAPKPAAAGERAAAAPSGEAEPDRRAGRTQRAAGKRRKRGKKRKTRKKRRRR